METRIPSLFARYNEIKQANPNLRIRDAAHELHVSEAELIEAQVSGTSFRLKPTFQEILESVPSLGHVMALTRNPTVVHERKGTYEQVSFSGHVGLVLGEDIDLRLFIHAWKFAFAVEDGRNTSLQFFDAQGVAVHKIFLQPESNREAYHKILNQFQAIDSDPIKVVPLPEKKEEFSDAEIDVQGFQKDWQNLQDTHDFFPMLRKYKVSRTQALRLAPEGYVHKVSLDYLTQVLQNVVKEGFEIMVFVGNPGCIQIHTGSIQSWKPMGPWWNVLDPSFNLHLNSAHVASVYQVKKPTVDGIVTSIELFDAQGEQIVQFFGKRKPGQPELARWRGLLQECLV